jgi:uncharacterized protein YbaP (TraB family)
MRDFVSMRVLRVLVLALVLAAASAPITGCRRAAPQHSGEQASAARGLALWQVSKDGQSDYIFGTCHVGVALAEALPREMQDLVTGADLFVMEANMAELMRPEVAKRLMLPEGTSLEALLGPEDWQRAVKEFELGPKADAMSKFHPFALISLVVQKLAAEEAGPGTAGAGLMDLALAGMAQAAGVRAGYLETAGEQLDVFLGRDMEIWLTDLRELMDPAERAEGKEKLAMVLSVCRQEDWTDALAFLQSEADADPDWEQTLLLERNQNWIPRLEKFFAQGQVFVAAGAGHMIGTDSVLGLLEERGYTVRRMRGVTVPREVFEGREGTPEGAGGEGGEVPQVPREQFAELMAGQLPPLLCSAESPFMGCFGDATARCVEEVAKAVPLCRDSVGLPEVVLLSEGREWGEKLGECIGLKTYTGMADVLVMSPVCMPVGEADAGSQ